MKSKAKKLNKIKENDIEALRKQANDELRKEIKELCYSALYEQAIKDLEQIEKIS